MRAQLHYLDNTYEYREITETDMIIKGILWLQKRNENGDRKDLPLIGKRVFHLVQTDRYGITHFNEVEK